MTAGRSANPSSLPGGGGASVGPPLHLPCSAGLAALAVSRHLPWALAPLQFWGGCGGAGTAAWGLSGQGRAPVLKSFPASCRAKAGLRLLPVPPAASPAIASRAASAQGSRLLRVSTCFPASASVLMPGPCSPDMSLEALLSPASPRVGGPPPHVRPRPPPCTPTTTAPSAGRAGAVCVCPHHVWAQGPLARFPLCLSPRPGAWSLVGTQQVLMRGLDIRAGEEEVVRPVPVARGLSAGGKLEAG